MSQDDGEFEELDAREEVLNEIPQQAIVHLLDETANSIQKRVAFRVIDKIISSKKVRTDSSVQTGPELMPVDNVSEKLEYELTSLRLDLKVCKFHHDKIELEYKAVSQKLLEKEKIIDDFKQQMRRQELAVLS